VAGSSRLALDDWRLRPRMSEAVIARKTKSRKLPSFCSSPPGETGEIGSTEVLDPLIFVRSFRSFMKKSRVRPFGRNSVLSFRTS
jgi:hypothetical protein